MALLTCSRSGAFIHAKQQLHADGDTSVPAKREDTDVTCYDRWTQQVLDCGRTVRVSIEDLQKKQVNVCNPLKKFSSSIFIIPEWGVCHLTLLFPVWSL